MRIEIPLSAEKKELFAFLKKNANSIMAEKKALGKKADGFAFSGVNVFNQKGESFKADPVGEVQNVDILEVKAIINTTNFLDSSQDVHLPGLWKKSLSENQMIMHLQEHNMEFDKIIADGKDLKAFTKSYTWKQLGYDLPGKTEALQFDSIVRKERNPFMFDQYAKGYVRNHSVWMQYIKMVLCINEPEDAYYGAEYEAWQKYLPEVANRDYAEELGFFWAVKEAKVIEGSAVPRGSNIVTPTLSTSLKSEPLDNGTHKEEPGNTTPSIYKLNIGAPEKGFKVGNFNLNVNKL